VGETIRHRLDNGVVSTSGEATDAAHSYGRSPWLLEGDSSRREGAGQCEPIGHRNGVRAVKVFVGAAVSQLTGRSGKPVGNQAALLARSARAS
jgi:hypothetical protein